ncbi:MAG: hypothetical protein SOT34_07420 [Candidatus Borkfalkiaceae bacterium]|nr:hypothetical protein [Christensenellaceae bacterium]
MNGRWIRTGGGEEFDTYGEFVSEFEYVGGNVHLEISADSDYAVFVNGTFVYAGQYADFPWYKIYDEIDIGKYVAKGGNRVSVWTWYCGEINFCHYVNRAGVRFAVVEDGEVKAQSGQTTQSRALPYFRNGVQKQITPQMGFSFCLDYTKEPSGFADSVEVDGMPETICLRPVPRLTILEKCVARRIGNGIYDLGRETVGLPYADFVIPYGETVTVSFGERVTEAGKVPRLIGVRDFSFTVVGNGKLVRVFNPLRKLGLRYFEVSGNCEVREIGVVPLQYPFQVRERRFSDARRQRIYDVAVRTLQLNAFEHYFDCPWREQAFYALDSRFQMRYGYAAFLTTEYQFAALKLMSEDRNPTGLVSMVVPSSFETVIPSFTLFYVIAMEEYATQTGDIRLIENYFEKTAQVMQKFASNKRGGLVQDFEGKEFWNFYEWNDVLDGTNYRYKEDCALNLNYVLALQSMIRICRMLGKDGFRYEREVLEIQEKINEKFFNGDAGLYALSETSRGFTELCNAYAVLSGTATAERAEKICEILASQDNGLTECTLSMLSFKYDALLKQNTEKYKNYILNDIDEKFGYMIDEGATSFWETMKGWRDFDNAGSLCHGWAALPAYYYALLDGRD